MKIPKYVERLIKRRERLAWELMEVGSELDEWLEKTTYRQEQTIQQLVV